MALAGGNRYSTCVLRCCGAYFSLDAAPLTAVNSGSLPPPPVFEIFTFQSVKHTGIGAHFQVKILEIWGRIRHINPLPAPGNLRFQNVGSCLGVLARIPSINFRFQGLTCGFFECIPENRAPTAPHVGDRP